MAEDSGGQVTKSMRSADFQEDYPSVDGKPGWTTRQTIRVWSGKLVPGRFYEILSKTLKVSLLIVVREKLKLIRKTCPLPIYTYEPLAIKNNPAAPNWNTDWCYIVRWVRPNQLPLYLDYVWKSEEFIKLLKGEA